MASFGTKPQHYRKQNKHHHKCKILIRAMSNLTSIQSEKLLSVYYMYTKCFFFLVHKLELRRKTDKQKKRQSSALLECRDQHIRAGRCSLYQCPWHTAMFHTLPSAYDFHFTKTDSTCNTESWLKELKSFIIWLSGERVSVHLTLSPSLPCTSHL